MGKQLFACCIIGPNLCSLRTCPVIACIFPIIGCSLVCWSHRLALLSIFSIYECCIVSVSS